MAEIGDPVRRRVVMPAMPGVETPPEKPLPPQKTPQAEPAEPEKVPA